MRGSTRQQIVFVTKLVLEVNRSAACGLGINAFAAYDLDRPSALICQRPSSIDRRDKRLGNGHARARRHRIKRAVGPIRPRSFRVHANYLEALNASRVRIHRKKPKALGLKFGCGFTRHLLHQGSPTSGYRPLGGGAVTAQAQAGTRSFDHRVGVGERSVGEVIE